MIAPGHTAILSIILIHRCNHGWVTRSVHVRTTTPTTSTHTSRLEQSNFFTVSSYRKNTRNYISNAGERGCYSYPEISRLHTRANRERLDLLVVVDDVVDHGSPDKAKRLPVRHVRVAFPTLRVEQLLAWGSRRSIVIVFIPVAGLTRERGRANLLYKKTGSIPVRTCASVRLQTHCVTKDTYKHMIM